MAQDRLAIIVSKGSLDMAYPPFILATAAAALDMECMLFFTFWGLDVINKEKIDNLTVSIAGNPGMPAMARVAGVVPFGTKVVSSMMRSQFASSNVMSIREFLTESAELGVHLVACQMSMDVLGVKREDLVPEVEDVVGAATFLDFARDAKISLFV
ncbi:MAG: peroxiredoxin family protein [Sulfobacillus thermosulfidooxidans]|uniref:NADH dehydrogenase n=1 Tax=Sulfobacillus thermotolerans TaxID=338644 RepID=A0ABM6RQA8_9FIRM|nr:DsrE/DsrF/DrsH-like family protein [Sulfobacillus sp. hq2]AUW93591.1 NADH dehydrogenase [Sulfobacillus thermotolerans]MCY0907070.1 DsrE/DsrF/DrsH-like family protein [Sulfobacillus thermotolerans]POB10841.1 peroxiredoxin family protein [Sulfobacillus sp. hq2]PSR37373.1 MAG: peroxiredoxin family protein [Sulfobacillus thermosulfidooxidans]